ncbi:zinc finger ccch domain-containing 7 [Olea europaea subsp. europaea]|uniref:Zinc finger ccch domain-containing 7 n=1 Tax=Olea europaea subsp. europaea TaxID=158383 RepID=A0A8S0QUZ3_OLEEU|nr:zinc finger ccch domain-containing 7 [Olea europaea subsp. europaea]
MDPPPFRHHHHHHHNSRYANVLHLPNFTPPPFQQRHLPPLTPPPTRPPPPPPHHLLPPIPPHHIPHNPLPPPPPAYFTLSDPHPRRPRSIEERSQRYEFDRPCSPPPPHRLPPLLPPGGWTELQPPPPPPLARENFHFRSIDNWEDQNPMFEDEFFVDNIRKRYRDNKNDMPVIWDRGFPRDGRKIVDLDFDRKDSERYPKRFGSQSEIDFSTDPLRGHESYSVRDGDDRRWDYDVNDRVLLNQESARGHSLARFKGRLGRGGSVQEFIRSPKKQVQKKSALLRIQFGKSSNRNRGVHEHHHFPKELGSSSSRGKEKESFVPSQRKTEEERERERERERMREKETGRSPVELDVSFKSNALVAKAIVASLSPALESDRNLTSRNRNIRKANSMSGSPSTKLSANSSYKLDCLSDPNKAQKGSEEKVVITRSGSANDNNRTYLGDNAADKGSLEAVDFNQNGNSDGSDRTPIHRVRKKRKLNMQIVSESSPQLTKDTVEIVNANTCGNIPSSSSLLDEDVAILDGNIASAGSSMEPDIVLPFSSNEVNISEAEEKLECIVSKKDDTNIDSSNHFIPNSKTKKSSLNMFPATSCLAVDVTTEYMDRAERLLVAKDTDHTFRMGINEGASPADGMGISENAIHADRLGFSEHADNMDKLVHSVLNLETSAIGSHNQFTISGTHMVDGVSEKPFQDTLISSDNAPMGGPSEVTVSIEDCDISGLIRPDETRIHEIQGDAYASKIHDIFSASESDSELCKRTEKVTSCASFMDADLKDAISNQDVVPQDGVLGPLKTEETRFIVSVANTDNLNFRSDNASSTSFLSVDSPGNTAVSDIFHGDVIGRKSCKNGSIISLENGPLASSSIDHSPKTNRKVSTRDVQMGLSAPKTTKMPVYVDSSVVPEEMGLLVEDHISAVEVDIPSHRDNIRDGNQSIEGPSEVKALVQYGLDLVANCSIPDYSKRKAVSPILSCTSLSEMCGGPEAAGTASLVVGASSSGHKGTIQSECLVKPSAIHDSSSVCLSPCSTQADAPFDISVGEKSFLTDSVGGDPTMDCSKIGCNSPSLPEKGVDHKEDILIVSSAATHQHDTTDMEAAISQEIFDAPAMNKKVGDGDNRNENYLLVKDDLASVPNNSSLSTDGNDLSVTSSGEELMDSGQDMPSGVNYTEDLLSNPDSCLLKNSHASTIQLTDENVCRKDTSLDSVASAAYPASVLLRTSPKKASLSDNLGTNPQTSPSLPQKNTKVKQNSNFMLGISNLCKNQPTSAVPRVFPGHPALSYNTTKSAIPSAHVTKSRTWHRTGNSSVVVPKPRLQSRPLPQSQVHKTGENVPSSYIRKGNSLVRKPSPSDISHGFNASNFSVHRLSPSSEDNLMNQASENKIDAIDPPSLCRTGVKTPERPETSSLFSGESLNCTALNLGESRSLPVANPLGLSTTSDPLAEIIKSFAVPDCRTGSGNNSDSQSPLDEGNSRKKVTYVKRRSYQLVAASDSEDPSILGVDKTARASSSDSYYKRRKNQLVRASLEGHAKEGAFADGNFDSNRPRNRRTNPGFAKTRKASKFSLVWKLRDTQLSGKHNNSVRIQKVRPYLFPWKRATYWRNFIYNSRSMPDDSSLSTISRKLLLSRKRGAIYTRSTRGFSLKISKVLSVGGSSLKWSKSIERNSKKANEEATRAVAAVEKRKKEQTVAVPIVLKNKNHVSRERIFRIGSERYKMDSTRKTLQRITNDEEPLDSVSLESGKKIKISYVPRRLLIGNEEYVRIGNGNQLVRDPKKRTRILASEKVRWSLHTARLRLTRKRKYCQFFTRFGKCSKDDGKCPYIHDPSKVVVCTKFLKGSCLNPECKLTHKVIPERMQDCSYFLQGLCSNKSCPYRHVNVNPNSSICESFLKGYCADGNECRKKHTYVCPAFDATGICPEGSKCKLHHPKRKRGTKRKSLSEQKNIRGRYFDSEPFDIAESQTAIIERLPVKGNGNIACQEELEDYICLDVGHEEVEQSIGPSSKRVRVDSPLEAEVIDLDELIKPIRIMNRSQFKG